MTLAPLNRRDNAQEPHTPRFSSIGACQVASGIILPS